MRREGDDTLAFVEALGAVRREVPTLLVWDNAPSHHPKPVKTVAVGAAVKLAVLPFRPREPTPPEDLRRGSRVRSPPTATERRRVGRARR
jgi:hypothetical protein